MTEDEPQSPYFEVLCFSVTYIKCLEGAIPQHCEICGEASPGFFRIDMLVRNEMEPSDPYKNPVMDRHIVCDDCFQRKIANHIEDMDAVLLSLIKYETML